MSLACVVVTLKRYECGPQTVCRHLISGRRGPSENMFLKRLEPEDKPKGNEDSTELQKMLTSCMVNRQILCCVAGVLIGIPISIQRKSYKPFAILGVLGSFVDYSIPYTNDCCMIHNAMQLALQQERQRSIEGSDTSS